MSTPAKNVTASLPPIAGNSDYLSVLQSLPQPQIPQYTPPDTSAYDKAAAASSRQAASAEKSVEQNELAGAQTAQDAAGAVAKGMGEEQAVESNPPSSAQFYAQAMHTAPLIAMMAALGGKAAGLSGQEMLGALNGMMSGFNAGSAAKYQEALTKWQASVKALQERNAEQEEIYKLMLDAYQGRADAAQKARDFALSMTGDAMSAKEAAVKDSIDIFSARARATSALSQQSMAFDRMLYTMMKGNQNTQESTLTPRAQQIRSEVAMMGISIPVGMGTKNLAQTYNAIANDPKYQSMSPHQVAQLIKENKITLAAQTKEAGAEAGIAGKVSIAEKEIPQFSTLIEQISAQVPRGQFVPVNKLMQMQEASISNPQLRQLKISINSLLNAYDVLAGRGGTDVAKREEVRNLLTSADSPQALRAALVQFRKEADVAAQSARDAIHESVSGASLVGGGDTAPVATFGSESDAEAAAKAGKIKSGDRIVVGGVPGTWQ